MTVALGTIVRNTAGGIALFVGLLFVLPGIAAILPASLADSINPYLPVNAGSGITTAVFENPTTSRPGAASRCSAATPWWPWPSPRACCARRDA